MDAMGHMSFSSGMGNRGNDFFFRENMDANGSGGGGGGSGGSSGIGMGIDLGISGLVPVGSMASIFDVHTAWYDAAKKQKEQTKKVINALNKALAYWEDSRPTSADSKSDMPPVANFMGGFVNSSKVTVHIKPEKDFSLDGKNYLANGSYAIAPGEMWEYPLDGIAIPRRPNEVFKVFDRTQYLGLQAIKTDVIVGLPEDNALYRVLPGYGWLGRDWQDARHNVRNHDFPDGDKTWDALFDQITTPFK